MAEEQLVAAHADVARLRSEVTCLKAASVVMEKKMKAMRQGGAAGN